MYLFLSILRYFFLYFMSGPSRCVFRAVVLFGVFTSVFLYLVMSLFLSPVMCFFCFSLGVDVCRYVFRVFVR